MEEGGRREGGKRGRRGLDSRGLMDFLIRDVGGDSVGQAVDFSGEVIVFAVHLGSEVVDPCIYVRIHFAEPRVDIWSSDR